MKKSALLTAFLMSFGQFFVGAASGTPATGEKTNIMPYIFGIVAIVLIAALSWLSYLSKKNKK